MLLVYYTPRTESELGIMAGKSRSYRGKRIIPIRLADELVEQIDQAIASNNDRRADAPYDRTAWIIQAIKERLDKLARGRKAAKRKAGPAGDQAGDDVGNHAKLIGADTTNGGDA